MPIIAPGNARWDEARRAWNLAVDQDPAAIALPESAEEVIAAVEFARRHGLRVAAQATGHSAAPLGDLADTVLIKTTAMRRVTIDPVRRTARAEAGVIWKEVVEAAAGHGLAALAGSAPDVGVVGYTLGGGAGWLGRTYGLSANNVESVELVTADGRLLHVDAGNEPELFWALRGGGGSFGVVTAIELRLFPVAEAYAGLLWWPVEVGLPVLQAWRELTQNGLPDEFTTVARYLQFPAIPDFPEPVRGKSFAVLDVIQLGSPAEADRLLAPLRALAPVMDTVQTMPMAALSHLHMEPEQPVPVVADGLMLASLPAEAIEEIVRVAGPEAGSPLLSVELRHLGGEMSRARPGNGALASFEADYAILAAGLAPTPEAASAIGAYVEKVKAAMAPWQAEVQHLNIAETSCDPSGFWNADTYGRLRRIKAVIDRDDMIRSNHPIPPARH